MLNLRLINAEDKEDKPKEFYIGDDPILFLPGVKQLNIIVGANNTRKSRFMRSVIKISHKILIEADIDINTNLYLAHTLVDDLDALSIKFPSGLIEFNAYLPQNKETNALLPLFEKIQSSRIISTETLSNLIRTIYQHYLNILDESSLKALITDLETLIVVTKAISYNFEHFKSRNQTVTNPQSYPEGPFQYMLTQMPGRSVGSKIDEIDDILNLVERIREWSSHFSSLKLTKYTSDTLYVPALRSSRRLAGIKSGMQADDIFGQTIKENYFSSDSIRVTIESGLKLYEKINYARNGNREEIRNFHAFEKFIGETFFGSEDIHIIPYRGKNAEIDTIKISIPGEIENVPMYDLGEGVQAIINLLFPIFTAWNGQWIFIDEPENNLHPGFQNIFIKAITENPYLLKKNLRYFINTHSNHILSESFISTADAGIFVFSKRDEQSSSISHFEQNEYFTLELLGVMNTSVLITNCSIWVEGITDRFYLRAFLKAYCKKLKAGAFIPSEGFDYSFVEYGGKNLVHFDFDESSEDNIAAYFINSNVFLLADSDFDPIKEQKYKKINRANFKFEQTDLPEIENIIPEQILQDFLLNGLKCDPESVTSIFPISNSKQKLGKTFKGVTKKKKAVAIESKSGGTLSSDYKTKLSQFVHENISNGTYEWEDLTASPILERITKSLYNFIKLKSNKS